MSSTELTVIQRATAALAQQEREKELISLAASSKTITVITNADGYQQVHSARMALKRERLCIEKLGKKAREDATAFSKAVIAEEARIIGLIEPEEKRLQKLQDAEDTRIEAERQAKIDAELRRLEALQERVAELRGNMSLSSTSGAALIAEHIADLEKIAVDESFQELQQQAVDVKAAGIARLTALHLAATVHEEAQAKLKAEQEELARFRAKAAEEKARQDEANRKERDRLAAVEVEAKRLRDAEAAKLASDRAELTRQQEELRKAQEPPKPILTSRGAPVRAPSAAEMVGVLAKHYRAHPDTILDWLRHTDFDQVRAA